MEDITPHVIRRRFSQETRVQMRDDDAADDVCQALPLTPLPARVSLT